MDKYRIIYIDEEEKDRENYSGFLKNEQLEVTAIHPNVVESETINFIIEENFDALIIDNRLMGKDPNIKYSGSDIIKEILSQKDKFPAFILTNNKDDDHVNDEIEDVYIFTKEELRSNPKRIQGNIAGSIKFYKKINTQLEIRLAELNLKRQNDGGLDDADAQELKDLNYEIERRLNRNEIIPDLIKDSESLKALNNVINDAQTYLDEIKKK